MKLLEGAYGRRADRLVATAKRNPEGVLLVAAGIALLVRGVRAAGAALRDDDDGGPRSRTRRGGQKGQARNARDLASDRSNAASADMLDYGKAALSATAEESRRLSDNARRFVTRVVDEQPLALALFGLAAGAGLANAFPETRMEEEVLAPAGARLSQTASKATTRVKRSVSKAGEHLRDLAAEKGLSAEGLRQTVHETMEVAKEELTQPSVQPASDEATATQASAKGDASISGLSQGGRSEAVGTGSNRAPSKRAEDDE